MNFCGIDTTQPLSKQVLTTQILTPAFPDITAATWGVGNGSRVCHLEGGGWYQFDDGTTGAPVNPITAWVCNNPVLATGLAFVTFVLIFGRK